MKELNFTDRNTYLVWRAEWREEYKRLSSDIRLAKHAFKNVQRKVAVVYKPTRWGDEYYAMLNDKPLFYQAEYYDPMRNLSQLRAKATELLEIRERSKVKSNQQYLEEKRAVLS